MKRHNKKGFTIVELVIVVAVIAILSAVLIPTFAGVIKKANLSADQQVVRNLNVELAMADDDDLENLASVEAYLSTKGLTVESYKTVSKDYFLAYSASLKKIVLVNDQNKVVFPEEYANETVNIEKAGDITEIKDAEDAAIVAMTKGGNVTIGDINLDTAMYVSKNLTVNLAGNVAIPTDTAGDGVFCVTGGKTLTLNGNGTVNGVGDNNWNIAVFANGGNVVINGGTYTNVGATDDGGEDHFDLIYVKYTATVTINGGSFKCETPEWTLNCNDAHYDNGSAKIIVTGGEFYEFNPADCNSEGDDTNFVADGYTVVSEVREDGTWYKVVPVNA